MRIAITGHSEFRVALNRRGDRGNYATVPILLLAGRFDLLGPVNIGQAPRSGSEQQLAGRQFSLGLPQVHLVRSTRKLSLAPSDSAPLSRVCLSSFTLSPSLSRPVSFFLHAFAVLVPAVSSSFYAFPAPAVLEDRLANRGGWPSLHASPRETAKPCGMSRGGREREGGREG